MQEVLGEVMHAPMPEPGSDAELRAFGRLQQTLAPMYQRVFPYPLAPRTVVVIPSMSLDPEELTKLTGASHYEERFLCLLLLLRLPATHVVYVTSEAIAPAIVDYYLHLLRGVDIADARSRLTMLSCDDASAVPLTAKLLARPALMARIRELVEDPAAAHLTCFNATPLERTLAVRVGLPLYGCDPTLGYLGTKSGSRDVFRRAGVSMPPGFEHLRGTDDVIRALVELKREHPALRKAVIKLEEGFSGEGNAIFAYDGAPSGADLAPWVTRELPTRVRPVAADETWEEYSAEFARMGGIVEAYIDGEDKRSPSVQCRIDPLHGTQIISTHDQVLGGASNQIYLGCTFPAEASCCPGLHDAARRVTEVLERDGVVARFGIDFVSTRVPNTPNEWRHHAIEINLRKGGTTHPYLALQLLTDGAYDSSTGLYHTASGRPCFYVASDNLSSQAYAELTPDLVIAASGRCGLAFDPVTESGAVFHLLGALSDYGKLGVVCIGATRERAHELFQAVLAMLDRECARVSAERPESDPHRTEDLNPPTRLTNGEQTADLGMG